MQGLQILLLTSRETRRWVVPKGWPMKGKKAHAVPNGKRLRRLAFAALPIKNRSGILAILKSSRTA